MQELTQYSSFSLKTSQITRRETYMRAVCDIRPQKTDTHRTRLTAGVNIIDYPGEVSTPTSNIRLDHHETPCKQRYLRRKLEIHVHGREQFLPDQPYGQGTTYNDSDFNDTIGMFGQI